jgi:hypothetical protein
MIALIKALPIQMMHSIYLLMASCEINAGSGSCQGRRLLLGCSMSTLSQSAESLQGGEGSCEDDEEQEASHTIHCEH